MKTMCTSLFSITIFFISTSCMENQHKPLCSDSPYPITSFFHSFQPPISTVPVYIITQQSSQQSGLTPIYRPTIHTNTTTQTQNTTDHQEQKTLLQTIILSQPDITTINKLYNDAYYLVEPYRMDDKSIKKISTDNDFLSLVITMNKVKSEGINEDLMAKFAYRQTDFMQPIKNHIVLMFGCLKKYALTINETKEPLPELTIDTKPSPPITPNTHNSLARALGIDTQLLTCTHPENSTNLTNTTTTTYPAYHHLIDSVTCLIRHKCATISTLACCIHEKITFINCSSKSYVDLKNEFYAKAYDLLLRKPSSDLLSPYDEAIDNLCDLLIMLDQAKKLQDINQEDDLGYGILGFEPTATIKTIIHSYFDEKFSALNAKKRITLFCRLVKTYNQARGNKKAPSNRQYCSYRLKKDIDFALPNSCDLRSFDETYYAFKEFKQLIHHTRTLMSSDDQQVQQYIDQIYKQKNNLPLYTHV